MTRFFSTAIAFAICAGLIGGCAPSQADIEKSIREEMKTKLSVNITSISLTKQGDGSYVGTATAENGDVYDVTTGPPSGNKIEWKAYPSKALLEKNFRTEMEKQTNGKVKTIELNKQDGVKYTGKAVMENGLKYDLSAELDGQQVKMHWIPAN